MSSQNETPILPEEEITEGQLDTSLTKRCIKFLFPVPVRWILIIWGVSLIFGTFGVKPVVSCQEWFDSLFRFYTFKLIPFDIAWALLRKVYRWLISSPSEIEVENIEECDTGEVLLMDENSITEETSSITDSSLATSNIIHKKNTPRSSIRVSLFRRSGPAAPIKEKSPEEIFIEKMRSISIDTFPSLDNINPLRMPCEHFEDAAHLLYTQKILYGKEPSVQILQRQFPLLFAGIHELIFELRKAQIIDVEKDGIYRFLVNDESDLKLLIQKYYDYLSTAPIEELEKLKAEAKEFQIKFPITNISFDDDFSYIDNMSGYAFEHYCVGLLNRNNYENIKLTKGSGDQGIDILACKDGVQYGIQCKCYSSNVGNKAVQEAVAGKAFYCCHIAVVMTNRYFTSSAKELAKSNQVLLWDRKKLEELMQTAAE